VKIELYRSKTAVLRVILYSYFTGSGNWTL